LLFWSEEDVREYKKKALDLRVYMNLSKRALAGVKRMQTSIFGFDMKTQIPIRCGYPFISEMI